MQHEVTKYLKNKLYFGYQFPLWDFGECNPIQRFFSILLRGLYYQFPLWDFGECNRGINRDKEAD
jgi:hypothetical protein